MSHRSLAFAAVLALAPLLGCASSPEVASIGPDSPHPAPPDAIAGPFVQAGTTLEVRLDRPIDTFDTAPGTPFTATLTSPLADEHMNLLIPAGAKVHGVLVSSGEVRTPEIRFSFETIETPRGVVPLRASLRDAEHYAWTGPPLYTWQSAPRWPYDFEGYRTETIASSAPDPGQGVAMMQPEEIHVPAGATMKLQLIEPLLLPGSRRLR